MIKFYQYYATNGKIKVKIRYNISNRLDGRECVTIYAKDYGWEAFKEVFGELAKNDTDIMTDYFEYSRANIFPDNPLYPAALARAQEITKKNQERWSKRK